MKRKSDKIGVRDERILNLVYSETISQREGAKLLDMNRESFRRLYHRFKEEKLEEELF